MADLENYSKADYQNVDKATELGTNQGQASQNVLENTNKNYKSGADYIKGLWNSPNKSGRFQAISNILGNIVGATGNALKGEGSKGTQWNDFVNRYNDTMMKAGEQATQDTSANVNTANVNAMNRSQAEQQLAQAKDIGKNTDLVTEANIVRGQNLLGGASAKDRAITDIANAITNALGSNNNGEVTDTSTNTETPQPQTTKGQDFQNDLNDDYESLIGKGADWVNDEAKVQKMQSKWTKEDLKNVPSVRVDDGPDLKKLVKNMDFNKGFGSQSDDVKRAFYTDKEWNALKKASKGGKLTPEVEKANANAKVRYANFLEMLER